MTRGGESMLMYTLMGPESPERYRREVAFGYSQGAPAAAPTVGGS